jgi:hypothetical protein
MKQQTQAVTKTETNKAIVASAHIPGEEEILSSNVVIPKLLLMQALSAFVVDGKAVAGEFVRSSTVEKLGLKEKGVDIIPLTFTNTWVIKERVGNKYEFRGIEPMTAANQDLPWEFKQNGTDWKRVKSINLYALLPADIAAEKTEMDKAAKGEDADPDKALIPVLISFRSTSFPAGKDVVTHFAKAKKFKLPGYVSTLTVSAHHEKNDQGAYFVMDVKTSGKTPKEYLETCEYWRTLISAGKTQIDNSDETETVGGDRF